MPPLSSKRIQTSSPLQYSPFILPTRNTPLKNISKRIIPISLHCPPPQRRASPTHPRKSPTGEKYSKHTQSPVAAPEKILYPTAATNAEFTRPCPNPRAQKSRLAELFNIPPPRYLVSTGVRELGDSAHNGAAAARN